MHTKNSLPRSLTRLVIGSLVYGYDFLNERITTWEKEVHTKFQMQKDLPESPKTKHVLIGFAFHAQENIHSGINKVDRVTRIIGSAAEWLVEPVYQSRLLKPIRYEFNQLVEKGEIILHRWAETGLIEEEKSRSMTSSVFTKALDQSISYLAANQEMQELVQSQSAGLASEVIEETRERAVSADTFLEGIVRNIVRKPPRTELPGPPPQVQKLAIPSRKWRSNVIRPGQDK